MWFGCVQGDGMRCMYSIWTCEALFGKEGGRRERERERRGRRADRTAALFRCRARGVESRVSISGSYELLARSCSCSHALLLSLASEMKASSAIQERENKNQTRRNEATSALSRPPAPFSLFAQRKLSSTLPPSFFFSYPNDHIHLGTMHSRKFGGARNRSLHCAWKESTDLVRSSPSPQPSPALLS